MINEKIINSFQGSALEISSGTPLMFTKFYIKYSEVYHEENLALWKVHLDDDIVWGPYLVSDHQTKSQNIIIFDIRGSMYLINSDGRILWKKKLDDIPISNIFQVDYYKNGKIQYLFNTPDYIYLIQTFSDHDPFGPFPFHEFLIPWLFPWYHHSLQHL